MVSSIFSTKAPKNIKMRTSPIWRKRGEGALEVEFATIKAILN